MDALCAPIIPFQALRDEHDARVAKASPIPPCTSPPPSTSGLLIQAWCCLPSHTLHRVCPGVVCLASLPCSHTGLGQHSTPVQPPKASGPGTWGDAAVRPGCARCASCGIPSQPHAQPWTRRRSNPPTGLSLGEGLPEGEGSSRRHAKGDVRDGLDSAHCREHGIYIRVIRGHEAHVELQSPAVHLAYMAPAYVELQSCTTLGTHEACALGLSKAAAGTLGQHAP